MSLHWTSLHCDSAEQYLALCGRVSIVAFAHQQPGGGDTPGVAVAPVALAGAIIPGVARFIVVLSAQADVFGVGATVIVGSRLVATSCVISGWIVPGGGLLGISGVESGKAAPLVGGPPGVELHTVVDELPSGDTGDVVPVVLLRIGEGMVPSGVAGIIASDDIVVAVAPGADVETVLGTVDDVGTGTGAMEGDGRAGTAGGGGAGMFELGYVEMNDVAGCADRARYCVVVLSVVGVDEIVSAVGTGETDGIVPVVIGIAEVEVAGTARVPGVICPVGVEQVT